MSSDLCIGIASTKDSLEIAALEPGKAAVVTKFPATGMGIEGIRDFCPATQARFEWRWQVLQR